VIIHLKSGDRWAAIDELIDHLAISGAIQPEHRDAISAAVKKREASMTTGIGFGIAIPHASTGHVSDVVAILGSTEHGIDFEALDQKPVHRILLFLIPSGQFQRHLNTLATIAKALHRSDFRSALESATDAADALELLRNPDSARTPSAPPALPHKRIEFQLQRAVRAVLPDADVSAVLVRPCPDPKFGDYQSNALMQIAKQRKLNPRQLATDVVAQLEVAEWCEKVEIAGAGFLNFRLKPATLSATLSGALRGEHLFFDRTAQPKTVVLDFSSPNVAKPMHVGHIRSTILGDSLGRTLRLLGHKVVTDNHIGDWGTQFGMLLVAWKTMLDRAALEREPLAEMDRIYKAINAKCDPEKPGYDAATHETARRELVKLQQGDPENLAIWQEMIRMSQKQFDEIYGRLGVRFDEALGESFYNPRLQATVDDLMAKGIARESEGAKAVFSDGSLPPKEDPYLVQRDGEWQPNPQLIQKRDGGFNYATTDLATIAYRLERWQPDEIIYVTGGPQQLHFNQVFTTFRRWLRASEGRVPRVPNSKDQGLAALVPPNKEVKLAHVWFGSVLGEDGRPLKTRSGENIKLAELLNEAEERAFAVVTEKNPELSDGQRREVARVVGIGAVKYADLLPNRQSDYLFSWDKMLALSGNTAPYLQYAYARLRSIFRKAEATSNIDQGRSNLELAAPEEIALAKHLLNFGLTLQAVADEYRPNFLCNYLFELAGHFTRFYENCPVLKSEGATRASRLALCELTGKVLKQGLNVLGIETLEQM
jgi:arginyl-tRNA synthetase